VNVKYFVLELKRVVRAPRFLIFTVGFPVVFYLVFSSIYSKGQDVGAVKAAVMVGMAAFGGLTAAVSTGTRIAVERGSGWQRQLRLTPLPGSQYLVAKALLGMVVGLGPLLLVCLIGGLTGASVTGAGWAQIVLGTWVALLPFAVLGVLIGQFASADSVQVIGSATFMLLSLAGGLWFPPDMMPSWLSNLAHVLPSFWYGGIGRGVLSGSLDVTRTALVLAAWTVGLAVVSARRFRADTARV
jgi:ABC-2 type transport system permease protein